MGNANEKSSTPRPSSERDSRRVKRARAIVDAVPEMSRRAILIRKIAHVGAVVCFFLISILLVTIHPAVVILVWIAGFVVLDFDFGKHERKARELRWAKAVLAEAERSEASRSDNASIIEPS